MNILALPTTKIIFKNEDALENAIAPFSKEKFTAFIEDQENIEMSFSPSLEERKIVPLRQKPEGKLDFHKLFQKNHIALYYPEEPRVSHQLTLVVDRDVKGIQELTTEEYQDLYKVIKKVNEIYVNKLQLNGFVIAAYSHPQKRHEGKCMVELHPHAKGFENYRNFLDKADSNRHVLFGDDNLSGLEGRLSKEEKNEAIAFWEKEMLLPQTSLTKEQNQITLPKDVQDSHAEAIKNFTLNHLFELLENRGALVVDKPSHHFNIQDQKPIETKTWEIKACAFCKDFIIERQKVLEYNGIYVLYNYRKTPEPGTQFLIIPKRHFEKAYDLNDQELEDILMVKKALISVLNEKYPSHQVMLYTQDAQSVGQTVPHTHEQVVALHPNSAALTWILMCLNYLKNSPTVSDDEMSSVTKEYGALLESKIASFVETKESASA